MKKRIVALGLIFGITLNSILLAGGLCLSLYIAVKTEREIDEELFDLISTNTASTVFYTSGSMPSSSGGSSEELLRDELYGGYRNKPMEYKDIPKMLIYAFVSIEDKRFFEHNGVDWKRTLGAGFNYILNFRPEFGGSTITQQLIKNVTKEDDYSLKRKLQEILWATDLEDKLGKEEILECYLNIINLSNGCYGVGAASEYYFSKKPSELTLAECASIAAITNNPSYYDPIQKPENNTKRRNIILEQMYLQGYISNDAYLKAKAEVLTLNIKDDGRNGINLWYTDMLIEDVINDLMEERGYSRQIANHMIYTGGLNIYSAMDFEVQSVLEEYYSNTRHFYSSSGKEDPQSAMIIIDPYNGDILGVAGAVGKKDANRVQNFATETVRPAGSVIKPLSVYAPALEEGVINYATVYDDVPVNFGNYTVNSSGNVSGAVAWPKNANGIYRGLTNVKYALENSVNTVTVRVLEELGLENSFDFVTNTLHLDSLIKEKKLSNGKIISDMDYAALALGQFNYGVTLREITAAYSIFPNGGIYNHCRSYHKVTDRYGNIILENNYKGEDAISLENSVIMTKLLENVVDSGTASRLKLKNTVDCAGKTGTTQNNCDRWFVGFTPYYIGGVWYGYEYPKATASSSRTVCIDVWDEVMTILHKKYANEEKKEFNVCEDVIEAEYCKDSGKLLGEACRQDPRGERGEIGYFAKGSEPTEECDCHVLVKYDSTNGGIASHDCKKSDCDYVGLITAERSFPVQIYVSDAQYVTKEIPSAVLPETSPSLPFFNNMLKKGEYCGISNSKEQYNRYCRAHFDYHKWLAGQ